ncbi:type II secretion system protein [Trichlorobacter ammonificans]|uniref:Prepilin-type N-terminal cleavage/methylation domain-containing protein n=1 Tax=Trichlorobacter ammonificans TaxID=2916410 RepID=A0ABN8HMU3_9BACT|nr:prepilin-type N-terminal cleavage/methylation domain-containing protein [Trichlorobacter ammonificans]CAH2032367.1 conserved protein of unknown function [Trichlorobacter ammonificans]
MKGNKGFTLVEMAIVLVIIGVILGAVIKGQDLIAGAKEKKFKSEIDQLATAYYTYFDKYSRVPGDDNTAAARWSTGTAATNGNNDGQIATATEVANDTGALDHLRRAGLLTDVVSNTDQPFNSTTMPGVNIRFGSGTAAAWASSSAVNLLIITGMSAEDMLLFDTKYDDGVATTGKIRGVSAATAGTVQAYTTANCLLAYSVR